MACQYNVVNHLCLVIYLTFPNGNDNCRTLLQTLQKSIEECMVIDGFRNVIFCFCFGEKKIDGMSLSDFEEVCESSDCKICN